ncbi:hypothetical protein D9758_014488 [Tetrapyrgos nigripes]|uniref:Acyl-CoA oxidase C-alpha1 domain-containing protein n=1 Tax=Tetrapyrgos nigripes TaxID=182062 RepID=A0A8H5FGV0_9AGAR|nr:hypothetical protein D9758_014488 [Tetrapyrgos nigripes]
MHSQPYSLSYNRAEQIALSSGLSLEDIQLQTAKFWKTWTNPALCHDGAATTLFSIQYNLVIGTLVSFVSRQPYLKAVLDDLLQFKIIGQFCLTEIGHGLDAFHLETEATLNIDGTFTLNTPHANASKFMPPTAPVLGKPCVSIVFARLVAQGKDQGIKMFLVPINDGYTMAKGVTCRLLPPRGATSPVNHSITSFHEVDLPQHALLNDFDFLESTHLDFLLSIWRVAVGTLSLALISIPALKMGSYICYSYSCRRTVQSHSGSSIPIISFPTQQLPIYAAAAQAYVLEAFSEYATNTFSDEDLDFRVRHGIATCFKTVAVHACLQAQLSLSERCGAQGLFNYNQMTLFHSEMQGISIAEGDILVLCIRLASELVSNRYSLPSTSNQNSLLFMYEHGLLSEHQTLCMKAGGHRSPTFSRIILPQSRTIVSAIGYRMAYDAALGAGVPKELVDLFEYLVIKENSGWFIENGFVTRAALVDMEEARIMAAQPNIGGWIDAMNVSDFVSAPIASDKKWVDFVAGLKCWTGSAMKAHL